MVFSNKHYELHFRRFEFKFFLTNEQAQEIKTKVTKYLYIDQFAEPKLNYRVNSLYYDSPRFRFYHENEAGIEKRIKIRARHYNRNKNILFWEIKRKDNVNVYKDRYLDKKPDKKIEEEIRYFTLLYQLKPKIWVYYLREPFISSTNQLRVTFDSNLSASKVENYGILTSIITNYKIMEIKFKGKLPYWLYRIIQQYSLKRQASIKKI